MECKTCQNIYPKDAFLPCPKSINHYEECVICMQKRFSVISRFLQSVSNTNLGSSLQELSDEDYHVVTSITCEETEVPAIENLVYLLKEKHVRPSDEQRLENLITMSFKCSIDSDCNFHAMGFEKKEGTFLFQTMVRHSCPSHTRNMNKEWQEIQQFKHFIEKLKSCLHSSSLDEVNKWKTDYRSTSSVYKKQQNLLHSIEDEAVKEVWGLPCPWRRSRGEVNITPGKEELKKLKEIAEKYNMGTEVLNYIENNLETGFESSYFQQRGYFIILCCAKRDTLRAIIKNRIQIMCYAFNLLEKEMFLLCYKKLNCTSLRNHTMMIALLLEALAAQEAKIDYPLLGKTPPIDSDVPDLYEILNNLSPDLFVFLG